MKLEKWFINHKNELDEFLLILSDFFNLANVKNDYFVGYLTSFYTLIINY